MELMQTNERFYGVDSEELIFAQAYCKHQPYMSRQ